MTPAVEDNKLFVEAENLVLRVKLLSESGKEPTKGSKYAAGFDLYAAVDMEVNPRSQVLVPLDLSLAIPHGYYGRIAPRSGLALKNCIDVGAGVVDSDYRGPLNVLLFNFSNENVFSVRKGDRIAQLILEKIGSAVVSVVDVSLPK